MSHLCAINDPSARSPARGAERWVWSWLASVTALHSMADAPGAPALLATRLPTLMQLHTPLEMLDTHTNALDLLAAHAPALDLLAAHAPAMDLLAVSAPALVCHPLARPLGPLSS